MVVSVATVPCGSGSRPVACGSIYRKYHGNDADARLVEVCVMVCTLTIERPFPAVGMSKKTAPEVVP